MTIPPIDAAHDPVDHRVARGHPVGGESENAPEPNGGNGDDHRPHATIEQNGGNPALGQEPGFRLMQRFYRKRGDPSVRGRSTR
jgi:hypothetical protein